MGTEIGIQTTVEEIVRGWLRERGYDGLANPDIDCACLLGDLMPCGGRVGGCRPGYRVACDRTECPFGYEFCVALERTGRCTREVEG